MMKKNVGPAVIAAALLVILLAIMTATRLVQKYTPSDQKADLEKCFGITKEQEVAIILNKELLEEKGTLLDGKVYVDYETIHDKINERFYWDKAENKLLYTTAQDVILVEADSQDYYQSNRKKTGDWGVIVRVSQDQVLVNLEFVEQYTDMSLSVFEKPNRVVVETDFSSEKVASLKRATELRYRGGIKSEILKELKKNTSLTLLDQGNQWDQVITEDGFIGYVEKKDLNSLTEKKSEHVAKQEEFTHVFREDSICMAWHQVTSQVANQTLLGTLGRTKGINVISPTWFYLNDNQGEIANFASTAYVDECHSRGIEVWGLVSNLENKEVSSTKVLSATSTRETLINKLVAAAIENNLDGINVDFESLKVEVGDGFIQFIRELSLKCHNNGLVLSVDNYVPSEYTKFYDRAEQAVFADYIIVMAYDEHYAGGKTGSVASINYVKDAVTNTLKEVPAEQMILGIPFYTRLWQEKPITNQDGEATDYKITSQALGMDEASKMAQVNGVEPVWDEKTEQYYVEYQNEGSTYKMWMEEENSIEKKLEVASDHQLAGASFWKLGFERTSVWDTILKYLSE